MYFESVCLVLHSGSYLPCALSAVLSLLGLKLLKIVLKPEKYDTIAELALNCKITTEVLESCSKNTYF